VVAIGVAESNVRHVFYLTGKSTGLFLYFIPSLYSSTCRTDLFIFSDKDALIRKACLADSHFSLCEYSTA
jgi:hypothetical protein